MDQKTLAKVYEELDRLSEQWADDLRAVAALKTLRNRLDALMATDDVWECGEGTLHDLEADCYCNEEDEDELR